MVNYYRSLQVSSGLITVMHPHWSDIFLMYVFVEYLCWHIILELNSDMKAVLHSMVLARHSKFIVSRQRWRLSQNTSVTRQKYVLKSSKNDVFKSLKMTSFKTSKNVENDVGRMVQIRHIYDVIIGS